MNENAEPTKQSTLANDLSTILTLASRYYGFAEQLRKKGFYEVDDSHNEGFSKEAIKITVGELGPGDFDCTIQAFLAAERGAHEQLTHLLADAFQRTADRLFSIAANASFRLVQDKVEEQNRRAAQRAQAVRTQDANAEKAAPTQH